jgi:chromosome segregation ATPase
MAAQCARIDKLEQQLAATVKALKERDAALVHRFETIEEALTEHAEAFGGLEPSIGQLSAAFEEIKGTIRDIVAAMADHE